MSALGIIRRVLTLKTSVKHLEVKKAAIVKTLNAIYIKEIPFVFCNNVCSNKTLMLIKNHSQPGLCFPGMSSQKNRKK